MASVGRRWVRFPCEGCGTLRDFEVLPSWRIRCPICGEEKALRRGLPRRREVAVLR
jgi:predicted RNA-binding Zn-ribbon protein involved in translation (DUF1610 family)